RVAVHNPKQVINARRALKLAFSYQRDRACFTFVEFLSTCPTNWGMSPVQATRWLEENMLPYYPVKNFKTPEFTEGQNAD
ncbi:MAG: 2-oxoglutarate oxidoreductase, partial [candidate division WOR-3 bacterium]